MRYNRTVALVGQRRGSERRFDRVIGSKTAVALVALLFVHNDAQRPVPLVRGTISKFEWAGCREILVGSICEVDRDAEITLWVEAPATSTVSVWVDGRPAATDWVSVGGGLRGKAASLFGARTLAVRVDDARRSVVDVRRMRLSSRAPHPALVEVERLMRTSTAAAHRLLDTVEVTDLRLQSEVETLRGKIAFRAKRYPQAIDHRLRAAGLAEAAAMRSKPFRDLEPAAFMALLFTADAIRTREVIDRMMALPQTHEGRVLTLYCRANLMHMTGDLRAADLLYTETEAAARRIGDAEMAVYAASTRANIHTIAGHHSAALAILEGLEGDVGPCEQALIEGARAWAGLMALEVGAPVRFEPAVSAQRSIALFTECGNPFEIPNLLSMRAIAELQRGAPSAAREFIQRAYDAQDEVPFEVDVWLRSTSAEADMMQGHFEAALRTLVELQALGARRDRPAIQWRAVVGRARALAGLGNVQAALDAYAEGEGFLDAQGRQAVFPSSLALLTHPQRRAAEQYALLLLQEARVRDAVDVLYRQSRRRVLGVARAARVRALPAARKRAWNQAALAYATLRTESDALGTASARQPPSQRLETDRRLAETQRRIRKALEAAFDVLGPDPPMTTSMPSPGRDEVVLGYEGLIDGWIGFAMNAEGTVVAPVDPNDAKSMLAPFVAQIRAAKKIRVVAGRAEVDVHALEFDGRPLGHGRQVVYTLNTPALMSAPGPVNAALVVADTDGTLSGARDEGRGVWAKLNSWGVDTRLLLGPRVWRSELLASTAVDLLHWAGHSRTLRVTTDGLGAAVLPLGPTTSLSAADVLALPDVPARVVLAGCETGPMDAIYLGVAQAFILAGAREVVATSRPVRDVDAQRIGQLLYVEPEVSLAESLRRAQVAAASEVEDWAAFRVLVP